MSIEAKISGERLIKILNDTITYIKILISLQEFKEENWEKLKSMMSAHDYSTVVSLCNTYANVENAPIYTEVIEDRDGSDKTNQSEDSTLAISLVMKIFNQNIAATLYCTKFMTRSMSSGFIEYLEKLRELMQERIKRTPQEVKSRLSYLKELYDENVILSEQVIKLQNRLDMIESHQKNLVVAKESEMSRHRSEIEAIRKAFNAKIKHKIEQSENQMISDWKNSEIRQETLIAEINQLEMYFENTLKERLVKEKDLRIRRYKVESQLVSVLDKYDADIGERHRQKEELTAKLEEETTELELLQERFNEQEEEYIVLMAQKQLHEKRILDEKIYAIRSRIAARTIQKAFRKYLARKARGKKKGKGKGKGKKK